ncbi:hypothetical protein B0H10DRAFT_2245480 [Mycena sp. CBHHK59/15]|nr:hypothetical protein B0H10DRAFT_2245480 [Mycena sp. CBHHK59/15]
MTDTSLLDHEIFHFTSTHANGSAPRWLSSGLALNVPRKQLRAAVAPHDSSSELHTQPAHQSRSRPTPDTHYSRHSLCGALRPTRPPPHDGPHAMHFHWQDQAHGSRSTCTPDGRLGHAQGSALQTHSRAMAHPSAAVKRVCADHDSEQDDAADWIQDHDGLNSTTLACFAAPTPYNATQGPHTVAARWGSAASTYDSRATVERRALRYRVAGPTPTIIDMPNEAGG